ncbi:MAG: ATP-binding protein [Gammaproteobacteria bacterium]
MFHIHSLELVHWDYWRRFSLPLDAQIITIVGPNGSGKTTLLDGLRTLFALECSGKRNYKNYARHSGEAFSWLRAVVDNRRINNRRHPFFPILDDVVTLACRIRKQGGDWQRQYLIAPGEAAIESLESSGEWLGLHDYKRRLDNAGITSAMAEVLALEQGETDKLCEYSPKLLLDLVFKVFGDQQVLDAYQEAKAQQRETERELREMSNNLAALENKVEALSTRVNRYIEWRNLKDEHTRLSAEVLPRLRYAELVESIAGARVQLQGQRRQRREKKRELAEVQAEIGRLERDLLAARGREEAARTACAESESRFHLARDAVTRTSALLEERDRWVAMAESRHGLDPAGLAQELGLERQALAEIDLEWKHSRARLEELTALIAALRSGPPPAPEFLREFRAALDAAGIEHRLLPELVEVADPLWQGAVEAVLAPYRCLILLTRESDRVTAWGIGERLRYRHFITAAETEPPVPEGGSILEVVRLTGTAPQWLFTLLNRVQRVENAQAGARLPAAQDWITPQGYQRERRGGRYIAVAEGDYHFGELARRTRLAASQSESREIESQLARLELKRHGLHGSILEKQAAIDGLNAAQMLAARAEEFAAAERRFPEQRNQAQEAGDRLAAANRERDAAVDARHEAQNALDRARFQQQRLEREIAAMAQNLRSPREEQVKRIRQLRHERISMPPAWRGREALEALRAEYRNESSVGFRVKELERRFETEEWETDENVVTLRDKLRADLAAMQLETDKRRGANERAQGLTESARGEYINVLRATVRRYGKNIRQLGDLAGIEVHCQPPHLENDDLVLAQAGLAVGFDFDRKGVVGLNDGEASGGQQVMKSLILLIGLMMEEDQPGGFVFIDEPFAHLDIFNIDRVAGFLKSTRAQYLITTPISHNVNIFDPTDLTLVTYKKSPGEGWAPPVAIMIRQAP